MKKPFYFWLCFGLSAVAIVGVWLAVITKTIGRSLSSANLTEGFKQNNQFKEIELKFKSFQGINNFLLEENAAATQATPIKEAVIEKLKKRMDSASSTQKNAPLK